MPDLNIKGSIVDNFGRHLPTPIIDYVGIHNDKLEIQVSLFFNFGPLDIEEIDIQDIIAQFSTPDNAPLYIYALYVLGTPYSDAIINKDKTDIFSELIYTEDPQSITGAQYLNAQSVLLGSRANYAVLPFSLPDPAGWVLSDQNYYDNDDNLLRQFSYTTTIPIDIGGLDFDIRDIDENIFLNSTNGLHEYFEGALTVFAFSSWALIDDLAPGSYQGAGMDLFPVTLETDKDTYREFEYKRVDLMPSLVKQQVSDVAYQRVFEGGFANVGPQPYFMDGDGVVYNHTPILDIDGIYYKQDGMTLEEIVQNFQNLIDSAQLLGSESTQAQNVLDDISAALQVYGESYDLLIRLNLILQAFPEKSTATVLGRFYERYKTRLVNMNKAVAQGTPVTEKVLRTAKIRDLRVLLEGDWEGNEYDDSNVVYAGSPNNKYPGGLITSLKIYPQKITAESSDEFSDLDEDSVFVKNGYWFFDYTKAALQHSNAAKVFNINVLARYFGRDLIDSHFRVKKANMTKWYFEDTSRLNLPLHQWIMANNRESEPIDDDTLLTKITLFETDIEYVGLESDTKKKYPKSVNSSIYRYSGGPTTPSGKGLSTTKPLVQLAGGYADEDLGGSFMGTQTTSYLSYLALRGVEPVADEQVDENYAVLTFEFQDVEEAFLDAGPYGSDLNQVYSFSVTCEDTTKEIIQAVTASYMAQITTETGMGPLEEYYQYAAEDCNYNNVDKVFNEFFTQGVMSLYEGMDSKQWPWVYGPILYNLHRDILHDAFNRDTQKIIEDARAITGRINPVNGNLEDLEIFMENYKQIITEQYEKTGADNVHKWVENMDASQEIVFGKDPSDTNARGPGPVQYFPLPAPIPLTDEYVEVVPEVAQGTSWVDSWQKVGQKVVIYGRDAREGGGWWSGDEELLLEHVFTLPREPVLDETTRRTWQKNQNPGRTYEFIGGFNDDIPVDGFIHAIDHDANTSFGGVLFNFKDAWERLSNRMKAYDTWEELENTDNPFYLYIRPKENEMSYDWQAKQWYNESDPNATQWTSATPGDLGWMTVEALNKDYNSSLRIKITVDPSYHEVHFRFEQYTRTYQ